MSNMNVTPDEMKKAVAFAHPGMKFGLGREGSHHGVEEYLEMKYLPMGGLGK